jgi:hypothetical protein
MKVDLILNSIKSYGNLSKEFPLEMNDLIKFLVFLSHDNCKKKNYFNFFRNLKILIVIQIQKKFTFISFNTLLVFKLKEIKQIVYRIFSIKF